MNLELIQMDDILITIIIIIIMIIIIVIIAVVVIFGVKKQPVMHIKTILTYFYIQLIQC